MSGEKENLQSDYNEQLMTAIKCMKYYQEGFMTLDQQPKDWHNRRTRQKGDTT